MTVVAHPQLSVSPLPIAGLLLAARSALAELGLPHPSVAEILAATGATRSRAYEVRDDLLEVLPGLVRPAGRPKAHREPPSRDVLLEISQRVVRFLMEHPGCVHDAGTRRRYAGTFRREVLELRRQHPDLDLPHFARAVEVPIGTVEDWLRPGGDAPASPDRQPVATPSADDDEAATRIAIAETVLHAWRRWEGDFTTFCEHVRRDHRVRMGNTRIAGILFDYGARRPKRRGRRHADEIALRRAFVTFFPGAQWVGDGTEVEITIDGQVFRYKWELIVDVFSGALVGMSVRDAEDSKAVVEAFQAGVETAAEQPIALLLDNRPSNHDPEVDAALRDTLRIRATTNRPQNKGCVEGAFGLLAQHVPPLELRDVSDPRELGRQVVLIVTWLFAFMLNHRPRSDRGGRSRADIYRDTPVSEKEREVAREALRERQRQQEAARRTREARVDPGTRRILDEAFERLGLIDPERHVRNAIAGYSLDAVVDAIAVFEGKARRGKLPENADARYLLGIVRNLHHLHESDAITLELIRARQRSRDILLQPLIEQRDAIAAAEPKDAALTFVDNALAADRQLDRCFWLQAAAQAIHSRPASEQAGAFRDCARRIHSDFLLPTRTRNEAERKLARLVWPID